MKAQAIKRLLVGQRCFERLVNSLGVAKEQLDLLVEKKNDLLLRIKDDYDLEDAVEAEGVIDNEDASFEREEYREIDYADSSVRCQQIRIVGKISYFIIHSSDNNGIIFPSLNLWTVSTSTPVPWVALANSFTCAR